MILQKDGTLDWATQQLGLGRRNIGYTNTAMWLVFSYIWLPFMIVPVYGALERIPDSLLEASADLGARNWRTLRSVLLPLALPGIVAGSIFTFSLTLGDFITPLLIGGGSNTQSHRQRHLLQHRPRQQPAVRRRSGDRADRDHDLLPARARARSAPSRRCRWKAAPTRVGLRVWVVVVLLVPLHPDRDDRALRVRQAPTSRAGRSGTSRTHWFSVAWHDPQVRSALWLSVKAGARGNVVALLLGSAAAFGVHRFRFFGREAVSLFLVLPIALPGIITGLALRSFFTFAGINLSLLTIVIGHATFCIVVVYNNVIARLRRTSGSLGEASMDLGAHGLADVPLRSRCRRSPRRSSPARCSLSRCPSTR